MKLSEIMENTKATLKAEPGAFARNEVAMTFEPGDGRPGVFAEPFVITFRELSANAELTAIRGAKGDPVVAGYLQAKAAIAAFNGDAIKLAEREWLWESLTTKGRQKCLTAFVELIGTNEDDEQPAEDDAEGKDD